MDERKQEKGSKRKAPSESIVLALLYYWTVARKPDPINDLGCYGLSREEAISWMEELVEQKLVKGFYEMPIPKTCLKQKMGIDEIITNPLQFREVYTLTKSGRKRLGHDMRQFNLIRELVEQR